jgi:hypothetical protein
MITINENFFSTKSSASPRLVAAFKLANSDAAVRLTVKHFNQLSEGLSQIVNLDQPVREEVLLLWQEKFTTKAADRLKPLYEKLGLPYHEYENLMVHKIREARNMGRLMEKMRR